MAYSSYHIQWDKYSRERGRERRAVRHARKSVVVSPVPAQVLRFIFKMVPGEVPADSIDLTAKIVLPIIPP